MHIVLVSIKYHLILQIQNTFLIQVNPLWTMKVLEVCCNPIHVHAVYYCECIHVHNVCFNVGVNTDKVEVWEDEFEELSDDISMFDEENTPQRSVPPLVVRLVTFLAVLKKNYLPDAALIVLLQFLSIFFKVLAKISPQLVELYQYFPCSLYQLQKILGMHEENSICCLPNML